MELENSNGEIISVRFREFQKDDAEEIVNLIRDEYGSSYRKRELYDVDTILKRQADGIFNFFVAELDSGKIIGVLAFKRNLPRETSCEITVGIILKEYRNFHVFRHFVKYVVAQVLKLKNVSAMIGRSVMYHSISQRLMSELGFKPCGFIFSAIIMENFQHSYTKDENIKHPHAVIIKRCSKVDAGKIFLPKEHWKIAESVYKILGVKVKFNSAENNLVGESKIFLDEDLPQQNCNIFVDFAGSDLKEKILEIESRRTKPLQTFNIFLNISQKSAVTAYKILKSCGYFFAGFEPICLQHEIMILHNPKKVPINFDTLNMTEEFLELKNHVKKFYEGGDKF